MVHRSTAVRSEFVSVIVDVRSRLVTSDWTLS